MFVISFFYLEIIQKFLKIPMRISYWQLILRHHFEVLLKNHGRKQVKKIWEGGVEEGGCVTLNA